MIPAPAKSPKRTNRNRIFLPLLSGITLFDHFIYGVFPAKKISRMKAAGDVKGLIRELESRDQELAAQYRGHHAQERAR
jgi:hypothetical protein